MTQEPKPYVTFSQRTGLEPIPPQLKLGEVSPELRRLIDYYLGLEISRNSHFGYEGRYFAKGWHRVATDLHVIHFGQPAETFPQGVHDNQSRLSAIVLRLNHIGRVFEAPRRFKWVA